VVQAYQKRAPFVIDYIADHGRTQARAPHEWCAWSRARTGTAEIKRAQVEGQAGYPVFTRKPNTDVSYLSACARRLLDAATMRSIRCSPPTTRRPSRRSTAWRGMGRPYEFQRLHGMGDDLYAEVIGPTASNVPCRVYAPVGARGPAAVPGAPPAGERRQHQLRQPHHRRERADRRSDPRPGRGVGLRPNPASAHPAAGRTSTAANAARIQQFRQAKPARPCRRHRRSARGGGFLPLLRARRAADFAPEALPGPTGESNRMHAARARRVRGISPWNFPLAIFTGQIAAALAAGNTVIAKPAEQTR
jgi:hypothetical protein